MASVLNVRIRNQYEAYEDCLVMHIIRAVSPVPVVFDWISIPHLEIRGSIRPHRALRSRLAGKIKRHIGGPAKLVLYHTEENTRYNCEHADYAISSDLGIVDKHHFRMPNWWTSVDWSRHGIRNRPTRRIRNLIDIETLMRPLGDRVLERPRRAAFFSTHMLDPRKTIFSELSAVIQIDGFGPYFDKDIKDHNKSGVFKDDVLKSYMFNLCPENSMYPGYYTEKVPEAFAAGCIPITWADQNIAAEFNSDALINLADFAAEGYRDSFAKQICSERITRLASTPLLAKAPDFSGLMRFMAEIVKRALR